MGSYMIVSWTKRRRVNCLNGPRKYMELMICYWWRYATYLVMTLDLVMCPPRSTVQVHSSSRRPTDILRSNEFSMRNGEVWVRWVEFHLWDGITNSHREMLHSVLHIFLKMLHSYIALQVDFWKYQRGTVNKTLPQLQSYSSWARS